MRSGISLVIISLGPFLLTLVIIRIMIRTRRDGTAPVRDAQRARTIVATAVLAIALLTMGVLIHAR